MPIQVTCPKCFKRFQVSEKFAGKKGPCPSCKNTITVPDKNEEVVIHEHPDDAPKDRSGQSVLVPIKRTETDVTRKGLILTIAAVVGVFAIAIAFRMLGGEEGPPDWAKVLGVIALAPPLVWAGYSFVYDSELEPYRGAELRNRVLIGAALLACVWLVYAFVPSYVLELDQAAEMSYTTFGIFFCIMLGIGAVIAVATFELEFVGGLTLAGLYLLSVVLLALVSGATLAGLVT
ncbi:hypothetical protein [Novipirellula artificiosorum]|uniref:Uncharacterized protein n=1 Tax=Novipirellula artificiosorum TaxID=2528016 RepID=A0A5C6DUS4_9BACT|nr:hypothetical protein [Novipirellula artificiosorum]TWU40440.1 hypothetical protein Poly41_12730 [Novipirellula artificiosorum]